jgi:hypothetical protein
MTLKLGVVGIEQAVVVGVDRRSWRCPTEQIREQQLVLFDSTLTELRLRLTTTVIV